MGVEEFDLDRSVTRAWAAFRQHLADLLDGLRGDDLVLIEAGTELGDAEGSGPFAQVLVDGDKLHAEISGNDLLAAHYHLDDQLSESLERLGWSRPQDGPSFTSEAEYRDTGRLAAMIVGAFRDVWNVPHPTFLEAGKDNAALGITRDPAAKDPATIQNPAGPTREDLRRAVDETLTRHLGELPRKDADGDIPVRSGSALVFVSVLDDLPLVELKSPLIVDIEGRTRAAEVLADLNATWRRAKFVLIRDVVVLLLELPAEPFVPEHLIGALTYISRLADDLDDELAERLGGRLPFAVTTPAQPRIPSSAPPAGDVPPELLNLLHLAGGEGLTPGEVARICGQDKAAVENLLTLATSQEISWRRAADEARVSGAIGAADQHDAEADVWQAMVDRLRAVLRDVISREDPRR